MAPNAREKTIRLSDVAKAAGVSQGTVSNVFNHPELVRDEVREKVREIALKLGYAGPDPKGRLLRAGKVNAIGVATTQPLSYFFEDPYARLMMREIAMACDDRGTGLSLVSAASEEVLSWNIGSALVDGFILFCLDGAERLIARSRERDLPFVSLDFGDVDAEPGLQVVDVDNVAGGRMAAVHLADLGHKRFAIITLEFSEGVLGRCTLDQVKAATRPAGRDRVLGSFEALQARGFNLSAIPIYATGEDAPGIRSALDALFAEKEPPTAIIAQSDLIALIALDWFAEHGLTVPGDVSIIGFDGVPEAARSTPPLTTIAQPIADIAHRAVKAILDNDGSDTESVRDLLDTELIVRGSTAPPSR